MIGVIDMLIKLSKRGKLRHKNFSSEILVFYSKIQNLLIQYNSNVIPNTTISTYVARGQKG